MDRGAWQAIVHGLAELDTTEQLILSISTKDCNPWEMGNEWRVLSTLQLSTWRKFPVYRTDGRIGSSPVGSLSWGYRSGSLRKSRRLAFVGQSTEKRAEPRGSSGCQCRVTHKYSIYWHVPVCAEITKTEQRVTRKSQREYCWAFTQRGEEPEWKTLIRHEASVRRLKRGLPYQ